jgi:Tol biopolymer transport system component/DNA-binding winged helix-turn-helix (wHTH) protein
MNSSESQAFQLGGWLVEPGLNRLSRGGRQERVEPRVMRVLQVLYGRVGHTVSRDTLMEEAWGHTHLTDDALNRVISRLRKVLADDTVIRIETIPKTGYRLRLQPVRRGFGRWHWAGAAAAVAGAVAGAVALVAVNGFYSSRTPEGPAAVITAVDLRVVPLTAMPGMEIQPDFSPDGSQVVFVWSDPAWRESQLYIRSVGTESLLQLTSGPGRHRAPKWSPDGSRIAYLHRNRDECAVMLVAGSGGSAQRVAGCAANGDDSLAWEPDGRRLVFSPADNDGVPGLAAQHLVSGDVETLTQPGALDLLDNSPAIAPDGRVLAFVRWHAFGVGDVYVKQLGADRLTRLTFDGLKVHGLTFEPDGRHLVIASNRGGEFALWRVPLDGGALERVKVTGRGMDAPVLARNGARLAWVNWYDSADIEAIDPTGGPGVPIAASTRWDWAPAVSPDGTRIAFASDRSGAAEIWLQSLVGGLPTRLTGFDGPYTGHPAWSPDGRRLAFEVPAEGQFDIWMADAEGASPRRVTDSPQQDRAPSWSEDGSALYFSSNRSGDWQIWRRELESGEETQVSRDGGFMAREIGGSLYIARHTPPGGLWRLDPGAGDAVLLFDLQPFHAGNWRFRNAMFFHAAREADGSHALYRYDPETGSSLRLRALPGIDAKSGLDFLPDGRIVYSRVADGESDLSLAELREQ